MRSVTLSPHSSALDGFLSKRGRSRYFVVYVMIVGSLIGTFVALAAYVMKPMIVCALPVGIAAILPTLLLKNFRLYWFCIYLMSLQFTLTKNLNDGRAIIDSLKIDYTIDYFTFEIDQNYLSVFNINLDIYNVEGKLILKKEFTNESKYQQINSKDWMQGIYFYRMTVNGNLKNQGKLIRI